MLQFIRITVLFLVIVQATNPHRPAVINNFVNCISELVKTNFIKPGFLVFANTNNSSASISTFRGDMLKRIHESRKFIVQITLPDDKPICDENRNVEKVFWQMDPFNFSPVADYFVIIVDSYKDFTYLARKIIRNRFWNPYAKFLIVFFYFTRNDDDNISVVENVLSCLFRYNVINIIVAAPKARDERYTIIYSWTPYDPPKFCGHINETAKNRLLVVNQCGNGRVKYRGEIFKDKLPINMQGCILNILALERQPFISRNNNDPNIEKLLANAVLRKYNFTVKYEIINRFRGERNEKGIWNGGLKKLTARKGHILLGGIFPDFDVHEDFECSSSYFTDSYTWVVPRSYPSPPWISLSITFQQFVWYCATAGFITCVLMWKLLGHLSKDSYYHQNFIHCFLNTWLCLLGLSTYIRPVKQSLRVFFVFLNLYCIIFLTAYQTKLIDVLKNPTFQDQVDTVEDLVQSNLKFGGFEELHDLFYNSSDPFDYLVDKKWIDTANMIRALEDVVVHRNFSVLCSRLELTHLSAILPELSDGFGNNKYYAFPLNTFSVPLEMIALRGFPFMKKISHDLKLYMQLGINAGLRRHFAVVSNRKRAKLPRPLIKGKFHALSVQHLQSGFFALAVGVIGGIIILFLEIMYSLLQGRLLQIRMLIRKYIY